MLKKSESRAEGPGSQTGAVRVTRHRSVSHPRYSLKQSEELARLTFDEGARGCDQDIVAAKMKYKNAQNGAFRSLRAAANQFGLITYDGDVHMSVAERWIEVFHADDIDLLLKARQEAMEQPDLYRQLLAKYADRQLPSLDRLEKELYLGHDYGILKDAASLAARVFVDSATYAGMIDTKGFLRAGGNKSSSTALGEPPANDDATDVSAAPSSMQANSQVRNILAQGNQEVFAIPEGLDRLEVQLRGGRRAYLFVPVPLPAVEKERLKKYIDLILEDEELNTPTPLQES